MANNLLPFNVGDWLKCPEVKALRPDYRGLWFDMICYMWESAERGVMVRPNGEPYTHDEIVRIIGLDCDNSGKWLNVLIENGVCSVRKEDGAVFCRRIVKDEAISRVRREAGKKGGNPNLVNLKVKPNDNQTVDQKTETVKHSPETESVSKQEAEFDAFRKAYPGTKRGLKTEFDNFKKKHKDYREVIPKLMPALEALKDWRKKAKEHGQFVPEYANLQTWINQRRWESEFEKLNDNGEAMQNANARGISGASTETPKDYTKGF